MKAGNGPGFHEQGRNALFDNSARAFAGAIDAQVSGGRYVRGALFLDLVRSHLAEGSRLLDYGCGPGRMAVLLGSSGYSVLGIDPSKGMIEEARRYGSESAAVRFEVIDQDGVLKGAPLFDGIVCSSVIEYENDDAGLLVRLRSWLRPGGILVLSFPNIFSIWRAYAKLRFGRTAPHFAFQKHEYSPAGIRRLAGRAGLVPLGRTLFFESPADGWLVGRQPYYSGLLGSLGLAAFGLEEDARSVASEVQADPV